MLARLKPEAGRLAMLVQHEIGGLIRTFGHLGIENIGQGGEGVVERRLGPGQLLRGCGGDVIHRAGHQPLDLGGIPLGLGHANRAGTLIARLQRGFNQLNSLTPVRIQGQNGL